MNDNQNLEELLFINHLLAGLKFILNNVYIKVYPLHVSIYVITEMY